MIETPVIVETEAMPMARLRAKVAAREIQTQMGALLRELQEELRHQGIATVGAWFTHHFQRPGEWFDFEVCWQVERPIQAHGRVEPGEWPAMQMVRTVYVGPYEGLGEGWGEFMGWIQNENLSIGEEIWERYLVGPDSESDSSRWRTELNRPLLANAARG